MKQKFLLFHRVLTLELVSKLLYKINEVLKYHEDVMTVITLLEGARHELHKEDFNVKVYRKSILDAFNLVKKIGGV